MDSKKKAPVKKLGKKQFRNHALLDGLSVSEMTKEQLEGQVQYLQQEAEREREERNFFQIERDKIQQFWEVSKREVKEKNALLRLKDSEIDAMILAHSAEIKIYNQKMKHVMFECQEHIENTMKQRMGDKLAMQEEYEVHAGLLKDEIDKLKDDIIQLNINHENTMLNQQLQHGEELCELHDQYHQEIDSIRKREVDEIGLIRSEMDSQWKRTVEDIEDKKNAHTSHLIQTHEVLLQKMKNYYNDIIKNNVLLVKSLKDQLHDHIRKGNHYKETIKNLQRRISSVEENKNKINQQMKKQESDTDWEQSFQQKSAELRNLKRHLKSVEQENHYLFQRLMSLKKEDKLT